MRTRCLPYALGVSLLAACAPNSPVVPLGATSHPTAALPSTAGTALTHDGGVAYANEIPRQISLPLPAALVAAGGPIVAQGGGNYRLFAADADATAAASTPKQPNSLARTLHDQMQIYANTTQMVSSVLGGIAAAHLPPSTPVTFADDSNTQPSASEKQLPANQLTAELMVTSSYAVVAIYQGAAVDPTHQVCAIRYTDSSHGTAVYRQLKPDAQGNLGTIATTFDLTAGKVSADALFDGRNHQPAGDLWRVHWEFAKIDAAPAGHPTFTMRASAYDHAAVSQNTGLSEISVNFLGDAGAAGIVELLPEMYKAQLNGQLVFLHADGSDPTPDGTQPHAFYVDRSNHDLASTAASAALQAIVPADGDIYQPYVQDPLPTADADPQAEAAFAFPH